MVSQGHQCPNLIYHIGLETRVDHRNWEDLDRVLNPCRLVFTDIHLGIATLTEFTESIIYPLEVTPVAYALKGMGGKKATVLLC